MVRMPIWQIIVSMTVAYAVMSLVTYAISYYAKIDYTESILRIFRIISGYVGFVFLKWIKIYKQNKGVKIQ
jgi:hypothetical protein